MAVCNKSSILNILNDTTEKTKETEKTKKTKETDQRVQREKMIRKGKCSDYRSFKPNSIEEKCILKNGEYIMSHSLGNEMHYIYLINSEYYQDEICLGDLID